MLKIIDIFGISWGTGSLIYDYLNGAVWWAWMIDAGLLVYGIVSGGVASLMKQAVKIGLKQAIKGLSRTAAIAL